MKNWEHPRHTPAFDRRVRDGYARGEPIRHIARALGVTRNAVIGRANRMGLAGTFGQPRNRFARTS